MTIFGVGCAGNRILSGTDFIAINTDKGVLDACRAGEKLLIGEKRFRGRGGAEPHIIMEAAAEVVPGIAELCTGPVIIVAGLGKGTGTGIAPLVARIAQKKGCPVKAIVTTPHPREGLECLAYARVALRTLAGVEVVTLSSVTDSEVRRVLDKAAPSSMPTASWRTTTMGNRA
jgi:cell division protein FtsZ